ncbi:MAG: DUF4430 domain-containing protein [Defluviitaleaceae bacterium]|nr:DUF4430 domain-containing protein [Defluviitaleaceae bacterium]
MKKHKTKFIAAAIVLAVLAGAWFLGGAPEVYHPTYHPVAEEVQTPIVLAQAVVEPEIVEVDEADEPSEEALEEPAEEIVEELIEEIIEEVTEEIAEEPIEEEMTVADDGSFTVTLSVRAHTILYNMHLLHVDKHELVPDDGWILPPTQVVAYEGESVFNVLQREMRRNRIHMASRFTPVFNSAYVEAINNLYEFDVGPLSGWMYSVNGWFPNFGASRYLLSPDDVIEWLYTVDLGRDLGVDWVAHEQRDE